MKHNLSLRERIAILIFVIMLVIYAITISLFQEASMQAHWIIESQAKAQAQATFSVDDKLYQRPQGTGLDAIL